MESKPKGIFCLEADWSNDLKQPSTVEPILDLMDQRETSRVRHIRRDVATTEELRFFLDKWTQEHYRTHPILYLAFHGEPGEIFLNYSRNVRHAVSLETLEEWLAGKCHRRIIHFGSCRTLELHGNRLNRFIRRTDALAITGFRGDVVWTTSAAFDLLLLTEFQYSALTVAGVKAAEKRLRRIAATLGKELEFRMVVRKAEWR